MESSGNAPASPEQGDDVVTREAARGGEPAREEAPQSSDVDGDASASERATTGDSRERREEGHEVDAGNAPAGGDDSEDDARSDGSDSSSEEEVSGLAALIRKLALKAEEKKAAGGDESALSSAPAEAENEPLPPVLSSFDLRGVAEHIRSGKCSNIIVMAGAGISVSAGIPDFRTPGTGLYSNLAKYDLPHPTAVFELDFFRSNPEPFYLLAAELYPGRYPPTPTHHFVKLLHDKGLLLRCFTQNIDSLEAAAGVPADKIVAAHGNFDSARCLSGHHACVSEVKKHVDRGEVMRCARDDCDALVKPDIVFFGENLPERFGEKAHSDFPKCDLLVVAGTSLAVHPFAGLVNHPGEDVPRLLVNRERVGEADARVRAMAALVGHTAGLGFDFDSETNRRDALFLGDCDDGFRELARLLGWDAELETLVEAGKAETRGGKDAG
jgi:NAD-dependent deacetylase sirtuin 2